MSNDDRAGLERDLDQAGTYLAELRYIDQALQYIVERNQAAGASPGQELVMTLGTTHPFEAPAMMVPTTVDPQAELVAFSELADQASRWAAGEMDFLRHLVREIMYYPVAGYAPMDETLRQVFATLERRVGDDFAYLGDEIGEWSGPAASEFKSLFYHKFSQIKDNQMRLIWSLQAGLETSRRIVTYSQQSLVNAVAGGRDALLDQLYLRSVGDTHTISTRVVLLVVAGSLAVASSVVSGPLWAAALTGPGFVAEVAAGELPADATERDIAGRSAEEVHSNLLDAVREVGVFLGRQLDDLHDQLRAVREAVAEARQDHALRPRRPRLADGVLGSDFYHRSSEQYP